MKKLIVIGGLIIGLVGCANVDQSLSNLQCSFDTSDNSCTIEQIKEKYANNPTKLKQALEKKQPSKKVASKPKPQNKATTTTTTETTEKPVIQDKQEPVKPVEPKKTNSADKIKQLEKLKKQKQY